MWIVSTNEKQGNYVTNHGSLQYAIDFIDCLVIKNINFISLFCVSKHKSEEDLRPRPPLFWKYFFK